MLRHLLIAATSVMMLAWPAHAVEKCAATAPPEAAVKAKAFLDRLVAGKGSDGVAAVLGDSPLWATRPGASEQLNGQIDAAVKAYGVPTRWEAYCGDALGTMAFREYYLVQHREILTRWEFDFARTATGWKIVYFGFTDQQPSWF